MKSGGLAMIDIHSHIIYGIDDGAQTLEDAIALIDMAYEDGIRGIIATPHYGDVFRYEKEEMEAHFDEIIKKIAEEKPEMKLLLGNECYLDENLMDALRNKKCKTLADSNYVLIEINQNKMIKTIEKMISELIFNGYTPIIAHCERTIDKKEDLKILLGLKNLGCLLQINTSVILKRKKWWIKRWIFWALKNRVISFVSSDAHNLKDRRPILSKAYNKVKRKVGIEIAHEVFHSNGKKIINSANSGYEALKEEMD